MIEIRDLRFRYPDAGRPAVDGVSFDIGRGSFVAVIGPNGSGKTTLLGCIAGALKPESGFVRVNGLQVDAARPRELARRMAIVHQSADYGFDFTVHDTVLMGRYPHVGRFRTETADDLAEVEAAMKATAVWELRGQKLRAISGGERQRVMIARAIAQRPEVLLLDEPISHLDLKYQIEILQICRRLNASGITILVTLHDINMASRFADRIMILRGGRIHSFGAPADVVTDAAIREVYDVSVEIVDRGYPMVIPTDGAGAERGTAAPYASSLRGL